MVKNHKNHDIDIITSREVILVPLEIFTSKTMVELKLGKLFYAMSPEVVYLPSLKTLYLDTVYFHSNFSSEELLTACPVLEDLTICDGIWQNGECCRTMSSSTFKKLTIKSIRFNNSVMSFDTPSLAYLEYTDVVPRDYPIVNLESLVEAKLDLYRPRFDISNPTNLIKGLRNVEVLEISSIRTSEMLYHFREAIPVFSNLIRLTITTHFYSYHWKYLPILVRKTPNLHTLIIKGPLPVFKFEGEYGSCPVKVLKITEYIGTIAELEKLKHFLEKLSSLEHVKVCACAIKDKEKDRITKDLLRVPRSSKCNIKIKFCEKTK